MKFITCFTLSLSVLMLCANFSAKSVEIGVKKGINNIQKQKVMQKTFAMIKPSGVAKTAEIKSIIQSYGLKIIKTKKLTMTEKKFNKLYFMHKDKPFFNDLKNSLVNKEVEVMVLYGDRAVERYRDAVVDIRSKYALNKTENAVHGSDSWKRAHEEICIFFEC